MKPRAISATVLASFLLAALLAPASSDAVVVDQPGFTDTFSLATNEGGTSALAWINYSGDATRAQDVLVVPVSPAGALGPVSSVSTPGTKPADVSVAIGRDDVTTAAWASDDGIQVVRIAPDGTGGAPVSLGPGSSPSVQIDERDRATVVWSGAATNRRGPVRFVRFDEAGVPGATGELEHSRVVSYYGLETAIDGSGHVAIAWKQDGARTGAIRLDSLSAGSDPRVRSTLVVDGRPRGLSLAASPKGETLALAWRGNYGDEYGIFGQRISPGGAADRPQLLSSNAKRRLYTASAGVTSGGVVTVAWTSLKNAYDFSVVAAQISRSGRVGRARTVGTHARTPSVATDDRGHALVTWVDTPNAIGISARRLDEAGHAGKILSVTKDQIAYAPEVDAFGKDTARFAYVDNESDHVAVVSRPIGR